MEEIWEGEFGGFYLYGGLHGKRLKENAGNEA
jgi:hypothetical protein